MCAGKDAGNWNRARPGRGARGAIPGASAPGAWLLLLLLVAAAASGQDRRIEAMSYPVSAFEIEYALDHPAQPRIDQLEALEVELRVGDGGLLPPHPATRNVRFRLGDVPDGSRFYTGGLRHVTRELLAVFEARGIDGVVVTLPEIDGEDGRDLRGPGERALRVRIWTGRVESVSTVADGDRFGDESLEARTNRPEHRFIREGSPVRPGGPKGLLRAREIEDHAFRLSRHPGRRVDAMLRPGELSGATRVEYHVAEDTPWLLYAQVSNTGTDATTDWRERFGIGHNQVTGNDDLLRVDYVTGGFDEVHGVWGVYEGPVWRLPKLRFSTAASWSQYDASEVGVGDADAEGEDWRAGGRLLLEVLQHRELFVDLTAGAIWRHAEVENAKSIGGLATITDEGEDDFFLPQAGFRVRRHTAISSAALDVVVDHNVASVAGTDRDELRALGTLDAEEDFTRVLFEGALSIFLEPAFRWRRWADPSTPASSTLAQEVLFVAKGQVAFDRLVPQFQQIAGGMHTVRGYEQAATAGDTVVIGSGEYRLHLPRLLYPSQHPPEIPVLGKVRVRPEHVYGRPDWDLILKAFVDAARVITVDRQDFESNETLFGVGVGVELHLLKHVSARFDLAWPQRRLEGFDTDPQIHTSFTLRY